MDRRSAAEALRQLSPQQKQLLRLVHEGVVGSKQLARETSLQPSSIKAYLYRATKVLDTDSRTEAASRFAAIERAEAVGELDTLPSEGAPAGGLPGISTPTTLAGPSPGLLHRAAAAVKSFFTALPVGGYEHALPWWIVLLHVLRVAIIGMIGLTAVVLFVFGFLKAFSVR